MTRYRFRDLSFPPQDLEITDVSGDERFVFHRLAWYALRLLVGTPRVMGRYFLEFICYVLGVCRAEEVATTLYCMDDGLEEEDCHGSRRFSSSTNPDEIEDSQDFAEALTAWARRSRVVGSNLIPTLRESLERRLDELSYQGPSVVESRFLEIQRVFRLTDHERSVLELLFIYERYDEVSSFFDDVKALEFRGRRFLAAALDMTMNELEKALKGKLATTGLIQFKYSSISPELQSIEAFILDPHAEEVNNPWYREIEPEDVPLSHHFVDPSITDHMLKLLAVDPWKASSTHILIFGPPGCGKTTYAHGLCRQLGIPSWEIKSGKDSTVREMVGAIWATINTKAEQGVIICDDCDKLVNSYGIWRSLGESVDKRIAHDILEHPGVKMIWICNDIDDVEPSVMRRFSYSIRFKPFERRQRKTFFANILDQYGVRRLMEDEDLTRIAVRFTELSPGMAETAVRKGAEIASDAPDFTRAVLLGIEAHHERVTGKKTAMRTGYATDGIIVEGLNVDFLGGSQGLLDHIRLVDRKLREPGCDPHFRFSACFFGVSGAGKSALARHVAAVLDREIIAVRAGDILDMYVGQNERNLRRVFDKARDGGAVLIMDELDALSWSRGRAHHSWESSLTSELLQALESFWGGIFIGTTNRLEDLDPAILRRFSLKVQFLHLTPDQNLLLYQNVLLPLCAEDPSEAVESIWSFPQWKI
ncbi:MAG: AAA family ATPase [Pseudomonadota bacterium]